ncbi:MAG TPA: RNA methyltransferase, partial [Negativicutes bacterium]|nr:RNA methyltransferase [Negativicutes bacterium]
AAPVYIGLVHYPIYNKNGETIATAVTNFDIHDIARAARTLGVRRYYIIHPHESQLALARDVLGYWQEGYGGEYNPDRQEALSIVKLAGEIGEVIADIDAGEGSRPLIVTTDARQYENTITYMALREKIANDRQPILLLFGTGYGITREEMARFDYILEPVYGRDGYNHLSVRGAVAIILDRLLGTEWWR